MGSFKGHALPGTLFLAVGCWHLWCAVLRYASDPKSFRVRSWNPVNWWGGRIRNLELYVIAVGSFVDLCIEFLYSTHLKIFVDGGILNPSHMNDFEHAGMLLMFFVFGVVALVHENTRYLQLPEGTLCLIAATAFTSEYLLFAFHSTTHKGLEGYYHLLLVLLIAVCVASCVAGALVPTSFPVDLSNGMSITLQGLWFYQTAFVLYGPMMPEGCRLKENSISCRSTDHEVRGQLFANFQLFSLVFVVVAATIASYCYAASRYGHPDLKRLTSIDEDDGGLDVQ
ncbi:hypothetical protein QJS10_CPA10g01319 [Acorus calamus]|uniref:Transmembrane protein 45B n=1 Tax=Acorus calamus TaxID=4465 RepID=A0AAV9E2K4_ACOCL|nr:hypothetical protein QJS10_CPA10g01319 [Acorus calamus]